MSPVLFFAIAVAGLVGSVIAVVAMKLQPAADAVVEDRLSALINGNRGSEAAIKEVSLLGASVEAQNLIEDFFNRHLNLQRLLDQADVKLSAGKFLGLLASIALIFVVMAVALGAPFYVLPILLLLPPIGAHQFFSFKRKRRMHKFTKQLPEALDLLGRSLRSGHSLGAGFGLISSEMPKPISEEFGRCFEEQNLGIQLEDALRSMTVRMPSMDLRFIVTSIVLQRQTGGDLVEILEKISKLIRERFKLHGQIQALTGEGRLSGIVLFMLPPGLFVSTYILNREYIMSLFDDPTGRWMVAGAIVMQLIGAFVIRKIVDIKV